MSWEALGCPTCEVCGVPTRRQSQCERCQSAGQDFAAAWIVQLDGIGWTADEIAYVTGVGVWAVERLLESGELGGR